MRGKVLVRICLGGASLCLAAAVPAGAQAPAAGAAAPPAARSGTAEVSTRAVVRSVAEEDGGRLYIRLKLVPQGKIPFSTVTYRVLDPSLVAGLREGESVAFRAERRGGENVLTAIRAVPPCRRFQPCE